MFDQEDYDIPLEKKLRLRVIDDEIDGCDDIDVLRRSLKDVTAMLTTYQHLLGIAVKKSITRELKLAGVDDDDTIEIIFMDTDDA